MFHKAFGSAIAYERICNYFWEIEELDICSSIDQRLMADARLTVMVLLWR